MTVATDTVLRAVVEMVLLDGTIAQNVFGYKTDFILPQGDSVVLAALEAIFEAMYGEILSEIDADITINPGSVDEMAWNGTDDLWEVVGNVGLISPDITFTSITDPLPNQCAPVVVAPTAIPGIRGRKFIAGATDTSALGSSLTGAFVADLAAWGIDYITTYEITANNDLIPGVLSTLDGFFRQFSEVIVNTIIGSQRRRKPGVGA